MVKAFFPAKLLWLTGRSGLRAGAGHAFRYVMIILVLHPAAAR